MATPFIPDRRALADASELIDRYGDDARKQAAARAAGSRDAGNVQRFCHWRQIERLIEALVSRRAEGTIH